MNRDFIGALLQLNAEKGVPQEILIRTLEQAIESAYRRNADAPENVVVTRQPGDRRDQRRPRVRGHGHPGGDRGSRGPDDRAGRPEDRPEHRRRREGPDPGERDPGAARPHRRADGGTGLPAAAARGAARRRVPAVRGPRGRDHDRHRPAHDRFGRRARHGQGRRGGPGGHRAAAERDVSHRPAPQGLRHGGSPHDARTGDRRQPDASRASCAA